MFKEDKLLTNESMFFLKYQVHFSDYLVETAGDNERSTGDCFLDRANISGHVCCIAGLVHVFLYA